MVETHNLGFIHFKLISWQKFNNCDIPASVVGGPARLLNGDSLDRFSASSSLIVSVIGSVDDFMYGCCVNPGVCVSFNGALVESSGLLDTGTTDHSFIDSTGSVAVSDV